MSTIREVLYQHIKGNSQRQIARSFDLSRDTIRKYIELLLRPLNIELTLEK